MVKNRINKLLKSKKKTRRELLKWLREHNPRISRQNLHAWLNNEFQPREKHKPLIAEYFNMEVEEIFYYTHEGK